MALDQLTLTAAQELLDSFGPAPTGHETLLTVTRFTRPKGTGADPRTNEALGEAAGEYFSAVCDVLAVANGNVASHSIITIPAEESTTTDIFGFDNLDELDPPE